MWKWSLLAWIIAIGVALLNFVYPGRIIDGVSIVIFAGLVAGFAILLFYIARSDIEAYAHSFVMMVVPVSFMWWAWFLKERGSYLDFEYDLKKASQGRGIMAKILARVVAVVPFCAIGIFVLFAFLILPFVCLFEAIQTKRKKS